MDRPINVAFDGEVQNSTRLVLGKKFTNEIPITYVTSDEYVPLVAIELLEITQMPSIGKQV